MKNVLAKNQLTPLALIAVVCSMCVCLCLFPFSALAKTGTAQKTTDITEQRDDRYAQFDGIILPGTNQVADAKGVLKPGEQESLNDEALQMSERYGVGIYILYTDNLGGKSPQAFSTEYYSRHNLGTGEDKDGIFFVVAVDSRDWIIVGHGAGADPQEYDGGRLTERKREAIGEEVVEKLHDDNWSGGAEEFLKGTDEALAYYAEHGKADRYFFGGKLSMYVAVCLLLACLFSVFFVRAEVQQMKTAREKSEAGDYLDRGSFELTRSDEKFVITHTAVVHKPDPKSSGTTSSWSGGGFSGSSGKF